VKKLIPAIILGTLFVPGANASITTYTTRSTFESALSSPTTFDFNQANGAIATLGTVLGISTVGGDPNGTVNDNALQGANFGALDIALPIQFSFLQPGFAFGYDNLDLTNNEEAVVTFSFTNGDPSQTFTFDLGGQAEFAPIFFGAISDTQISNVQIYSRTIGTDTIGERVNVIDNVTVGPVGTSTSTPEPGSWMLMSGGLLVLLGRSSSLRRRFALARD
jgi:hypothetical protein